MKKAGKYIICGLLGKGGSSVVYKARLPYVDRMVALKMLSPHPNLVGLLGMEAIRDRFISEAALIASLRHPNVIEVLDFDFDGERPFFTMEYYYNDLGRLIGESCRPDLPTRILSLDKTIHYTRQILEGLGRLYRAGMVHRDIKPGNIMISPEVTVKICDFGFSRVRGEKLAKPSQLVIGSPFYAAPEQERDPDSVDQRADLYSVGAIVHRMLTGLLPEDGILKPGRYHPEADSGWDRLIETALAPDPDRRFGTPAEMLAALEELSAAWDGRKEAFCRMHPEDDEARGRSKPEATGETLRSMPVKVSAKEAPDVFGCDTLMRPARYAACDSFLPQGPVVKDTDTGLLWQQSGSEDPLSREEALQYVENMNKANFGGTSRWRLPTVSELFSILRAPTFGIEDCRTPEFDRRQTTLWSIDRCTFVSGWHVNMELGFAGPADFTCGCHVRAVSSEQ